MKYLPLFELSIKHPYYTDGRCPDFRVEVDPRGEGVARDHRLVLKTRPDGILVVVPVNDADAPVIPFRPDAALTFRLRLINNDFPLFTEMPTRDEVFARVYTNAAGGGGGSGGEISLTLRTDDKRPRSVSAPESFALIEIVRVDTLQPSAAPVRFTISFMPRVLRWVYYVVSDVPGKAFQIVDADPSPSSAKVGFGAEAPRDLVSPPHAADPVAAVLAAKYPAMRRLRFVSDAEVACTEEPRRYLELHLDGNRIMESLPNPPPAPYPFAFYVIEHRTLSMAAA